jgi:Ca-activated chloride channel homolog
MAHEREKLKHDSVGAWAKRLYFAARAVMDSVLRPYDLGSIYSIGLLFGGDKSRHARRDLQALSSETGGIAFFPGSLKDIDSVAAEVARDIRNQYALAYHSPHASVGGYHSVTVEAHAEGHGRLIVYTRSGYLSKQTSSRGTKTDMK